MTHSDPLLEKARAAKQKAIERYGDLPIVNGIGLTRLRGAYSVKINVLAELSQDDQIAAEIDGVPVLLKVVGQIKKQ